jgi:hypothetical protein
LRQFLSRLTDDVIHISVLRRIPDDAVIHAHLPVCLSDSNLPGKAKKDSADRQDSYRSCLPDCLFCKRLFLH